MSFTPRRMRRSRRWCCGASLPGNAGARNGARCRGRALRRRLRYSAGTANRPGRTMIKRYSDHAANERTFLAWVRTAIAVMAFGFLIERFDLFIKFAAPQLAQAQLAPHGEFFANLAGLVFIVLGIAIIVIAGVRFVRTSKDIESKTDVPSPGERFDVALAVLLGLLGVALFLYLSRAVLPAI
jgi:putative membrane protein